MQTLELSKQLYGILNQWDFTVDGSTQHDRKKEMKRSSKYLLLRCCSQDSDPGSHGVALHFTSDFPS